MGKKQERKSIAVQPRQSSASNSSDSTQGAFYSRRKSIPISDLLEGQEQAFPRFSPELIRPEQLAGFIAESDEFTNRPIPEGTQEEIFREDQDGASRSLPECCGSTDPKKWGYRNLFGLSIAYLAVFTAFLGLQNLQSSINAEGGLGLASLSVLYAVFIVSGFVAPGIIRLFGTKYSLLIGFLCHMIYAISNYYPTWYTLIPSSILIGFAFGPLWASVSTHITDVAVMIAPSLKKNQDLLISKFTGIFFFFFQVAQIPGNLASSLILYPYSGESGDNPQYASTNASEMLDESSGSHELYTQSRSGDTCDYLEDNTLDRKYLYILVSVYEIFIMTGIVILLLTVDRLPSDNEFFSTERKFNLYVKMPFIELLRVFKDWKMILLAPMAVFNGMEIAFAFGSFTEIYISECFGTYWVGFTLICFGASSAVMSVVYGKLVKYIPRFTIILFGASINIGLIVFLVVWERVPSYVVIFSFAVGWGAADAAWNTMSCSLTGILFSERSETAYSVVRIWLALGFTIGFASAEVLTIEGRLRILLGSVVLAAISNLILQFKSQTKQQLFPCIYRPSKEKRAADDEECTNGSVDLERESIVPSPSHTNALFAAYSGRRPSNWSTFEGGQWRRKSSIARANSYNKTVDTLHENEENENLESASDDNIIHPSLCHINVKLEEGVYIANGSGQYERVNPSPSYCHALVAALEEYYVADEIEFKDSGRRESTV